MTELLANRYELLERIGVGGMAEVYRARMVGPAGFRKVVALKRILEDLCADQDFLSRFIDEARLTARLQHPNICQVLDFGSIDGRYFITMEYIEGLDLSKALLLLERSGELLSPDLCLSITAGVLRGLSHAHAAADDQGRRLGLVHRDVSPQNVLLSINGDIKLSDFGVAKADALVRAARTMENVALGKLAYMAPEQRRGGKVDERTDVFGTGILLVEMLQGPASMRRHAGALSTDMERVVGAAVQRFPSDLASRVGSVIQRAVDQRPERRYSDAISMLSEIEQFSRELGGGSAADKLGNLVRSLHAARRAKSGNQPKARASESAGQDARASENRLPTAPTQADGVEAEDLETKIRHGADGIEALETQVHRGERGGRGSALEALETRVLSGRRAPLDELKTQVRRDVTRPLDTEDIIVESSAVGSPRRPSSDSSHSLGVSDLISVEEDDGTSRRSVESSRERGVDGSVAGASPIGPRPPAPPRPNIPSGSGPSDLLVEKSEAENSSMRSMDSRAAEQAAVGPVPQPQSHPQPRDERPAWMEPPTSTESDEGGGSKPHEAPRVATDAVAPRSPAQWRASPPRESRHAPAGSDAQEESSLGDVGDSGQGTGASQVEQSESTARVRVGKRKGPHPLFWGGIVVAATLVTLTAVFIGWRIGWHRSPPPPAGAEALIGVSPSPDAGDDGGVGQASLDTTETQGPSESDVGDAGGEVGANESPPSPERDDDVPRPQPQKRVREAPARSDPPRPRKRGDDPPVRPGSSRGSARVSIYSDPPGVAYVDGRLVGPRTPVRGVEVSPGRHEVRVVFSSTRQEARRVVTVSPGGHEVVWLRNRR